jgi:hypothetical protein
MHDRLCRRRASLRQLDWRRFARWPNQVRSSALPHGSDHSHEAEARLHPRVAPTPRLALRDLERCGAMCAGRSTMSRARFPGPGSIAGLHRRRRRNPIGLRAPSRVRCPVQASPSRARTMSAVASVAVATFASAFADRLPGTRVHPSVDGHDESRRTPPAAQRGLPSAQESRGRARPGSIVRPVGRASVVVSLSPHAATRDRCRRELGRALGPAERGLPVLSPGAR